MCKISARIEAATEQGNKNERNPITSASEYILIKTKYYQNTTLALFQLHYLVANSVLHSFWVYIWKIFQVKVAFSL